jgi:hypothetical protein
LVRDAVHQVLPAYIHADRQTDSKKKLGKGNKIKSQFKASTGLTNDQSRSKMENIYIEDRSILLPSDVVLTHH